MLKKRSDNQLLFIIVTIGVLLRITFIPFVQITDADAISRILMAETWLENPTFLSDGIWLPIHNYFISWSLIISGERIYSPVIFHIIIACLTVVPLYHFTKREFSEKGAWFAIVFYLLCPIIFRNSFQALSGIPHAFFIALALNSVSKSIRFNDVKQAIYAGLFLTVAAGFRYEAWLTIALLTIIFLLYKKFKLVIFFWSFSMIFPLFWMIGNYIAHNDFLFGLAVAENENVALAIKIERLSFFPFSWFFIYSPIFAFLVSRKIYQKIKTKQLIKSRLIWSIPFWLLMLVFIFKSYEETLLMQHRFTILLILFSTPFISIVFENIQWNRIKAIAFGAVFASLMPLSYFWMKIPYENIFKFSDTLNYVFAHIREGSQNQFEAIPRISNQKYVEHVGVINRALNKKEGLILDFTSWDNTYYLALNSTIKAKQILMIDGSKYGETELKNLKERMQKYPKGVFLINHNSKFSVYHSIEGASLFLDATCELKVSMIKKDKDVSIFRYELKNFSGI